jgi:hypothetical protein
VLTRWRHPHGSPPAACFTTYALSAILLRIPTVKSNVFSQCSRLARNGHVIIAEAVIMEAADQAGLSRASAHPRAGEAVRAL